MDYEIFRVYIKKCKDKDIVPTWIGFWNYIERLGGMVNNMCAVEWIKLNLGMFDNAKLKIINSMPEKDLINYVWIRLLIQAGKINDSGKIYINKDLPYTVETLSIVLDRSTNDVKNALDTLCKLNMIVINDKKIIKIKNWAKYQNIDSLEKTREQAKLRMRKMRAKKNEEENNSYVTVTNKKETEIERDNNKNENNKNENKEKEIENKDNIVTLEDKKIEKVNESAMDILNYYEKLIGKVGVFKIESIARVIDMHGEKNVRSAIDMAIEAGKINMRYVNGILKNWAKEGYPEEGGTFNGVNGSIKNGSKFENFESKEPRKLTAEEKRKSKELI